MNVWLRRLLYLLIIILWLVLMLFPIFAFTLARNEQLTIGSTRIFLVTERRQSGIGFQTTRTSSEETACTLTSVRYIMWRGEADNQRSCSCDDGVERVPRGRRCVVP